MASLGLQRALSAAPAACHSTPRSIGLSYVPKRSKGSQHVSVSVNRMLSPTSRSHPLPTPRGKLVCPASAQAPSSWQTLDEVGQTTFWAAVRKVSADNLVVAYFFTDKCVQCKESYPQLAEMASELQSKKVMFFKFNCKKENKELGISLGIKRSPTYQLYRKGDKVAEMIGAKMDELRKLIDDTRAKTL